MTPEGFSQGHSPLPSLVQVFLSLAKPVGIPVSSVAWGPWTGVT